VIYDLLLTSSKFKSYKRVYNKYVIYTVKNPP
jgi:hypothetical protein